MQLPSSTIHYAMKRIEKEGVAFWTHFQDIHVQLDLKNWKFAATLFSDPEKVFKIP